MGVELGVCALQVRRRYVKIFRGCADAFVAEHFLHKANIHAVIQAVRRATVPQDVGMHSGNARALGRGDNHAMDALLPSLAGRGMPNRALAGNQLPRKNAPRAAEPWRISEGAPAPKEGNPAETIHDSETRREAGGQLLLRAGVDAWRDALSLPEGRAASSAAPQVGDANMMLSGIEWRNCDTCPRRFAVLCGVVRHTCPDCESDKKAMERKSAERQRWHRSKFPQRHK